MACEEVVKACDAAIAAADETIKSLELERQIQKDLLDIKDQRIKELEVWYRKPEFLVPMSIIIGILIPKGH